MARKPKFNHVKTKTGGWMVSIPPRISETGKRERCYFKTRDKARDFASELQEKAKKHGENATAIRPSLAEDAVKAAAVLGPLGISLLEAARFFAAARDRETASCTLKDATAAWLVSCEGRRERTIGGYKSTMKRLDVALGERLLAGITADEIAAAAGIVGTSGAAAMNAFRNSRAFWRWSANRGWCLAETFEKVETPRANKEGEIEVLTPAQAQALLRVAEKHYPQAVASYALQLFAGIRAEELTRLEADNVTKDGIELGASITKKGRRRHITPNKTLAAWLKKHPFAPCLNWRRVDQVCRHLAGWDVAPDPSFFTPPDIQPDEKQTPRPAWPQNAMRHSHASYSIASGVPLESLLFEFGHTGSANVLRAHYVGKASKKQALAFFAIRPKGAKVAKPPIEAVA